MTPAVRRPGPCRGYGRGRGPADARPTTGSDWAGRESRHGTSGRSRPWTGWRAVCDRSAGPCCRAVAAVAQSRIHLGVLVGAEPSKRPDW